jgi:hypothetical protein
MWALILTTLYMDLLWTPTSTTPARTREGNGKSPQRQQLLQVADLFLLEDIAWES